MQCISDNRELCNDKGQDERLSIMIRLIMHHITTLGKLFTHIVPLSVSSVICYLSKGSDALRQEMCPLI